MANKPVKIVETVLRDGHQSIAATRMRIVDILPVLEKIDNAGYHAVEAWGGATFDSCLRFLHEDPWQRLRLLKKNLPHTDSNATAWSERSWLHQFSRRRCF